MNPIEDVPGERLLRIARKDFTDAVRGRQVHLLVALFGLFGAFAGYVGGGSAATNLTSLLAFLVPLAGVALTQHAVAGKRESGELAVLLGLPFSRRDVVVGTYLGRVGTVVVAVASAYVAATVVGAASGASPDLGAAASGAVLLAVAGAVFVGIALAVSATAHSSAVASVGAFAGYLVFVLPTWQFVPDAVLYVANGFEAPGRMPEWATAFDQFAPFAALRNAAAPIAGDLAGELPALGGSVPPDPPLYMQPWFGAVVVLGWLVVPAALGYRRFARSDL